MEGLEILVAVSNRPYPTLCFKSETVYITDNFGVTGRKLQV